MSLVAYATSSDEESDNKDEQESINSKTDIKSVGYISDEDVSDTPISPKQLRTGLNLPVPKNGELLDNKYSLFEVLPPPKVESEKESVLIEEQDDEYLHKKATPIEIPKQALPLPTRNLVQITIPSLKDFDELDEQKDKKTTSCNQPSKFSSLISILPRPKSEQTFAKANNSRLQENSKQSTTKTCLVPDAVKIRRPAQNTENVERTIQRKIASRPKAKPLLVNVSDSEGSDLESDFFSLTNDNNLPEVSADEISAMVSKKAVEMAQASSKFVSDTDVNHLDEVTEDIKKFPEEETQTQQQLDKVAIQALIGSQAKRRKMDDVQVIDISSEEVLPNREDWLRSALASATTYQPTGVLADEEPAAGTRRKHQITYLAHKAKANEAELQAMWSANRQNRRQTQSKYGF